MGSIRVEGTGGEWRGQAGSGGDRQGVEGTGGEWRGQVEETVTWKTKQ